MNICPEPGSIREWVAVLRLVDAESLCLSRRQINEVLDQITLLTDAENEARALETARPRPKTRPSPWR
jgi:hypothetical protein